ncbi:MAG: dihydrolipoyl dehydrogenase [Prevotellaceae bacterium]|jgi:dihydrolipoamide dehydrogenase|nr:dihydrolipoyl dehydrogenase [Prevotellaceae bacterium]
MFDIIVIGSGPGGYTAAVRAAQLGFRTAVVERSEPGGICLNWGCIPTKALLRSAQVLQEARQAESFGVHIAGSVTPDIAAIVARSRAVAAGMNKGVEFLLKKNNIALIAGTAVLQADKSVEVTAGDGGKQTITAAHVIIATGARAHSLPCAPVDGKKIIGYREALTPAAIPETLAVIGSGAIGCELAYFYRCMGAEVTLIEYMDAIAPLEDADTSAQLSRSFRKAGIKVMTSAQVIQVDTSGEGCTLRLQTKKGEETLAASKVLSAAGITANIENIGLERTGVVVERGRIKVDGHYRTNVAGIYAIGDVIATPALAHVASAEAITCVEYIAGLSPEPVDYENVPACLYTTPEAASVGLTERAAREQGYELRIGKFSYVASGKAAAHGDKDGFVKLIFDAATDRLLGAHMTGSHVTEMIAGLVTARRLGVRGKDILCCIHPHPSMSEAIFEAAALVQH